MARIGEGQGFTSNEFKKAIYAIRGNNRQTKGMACAVAIEGQNEGSVLLVTADTLKPITGCQLHRYSRKKKNFEDYQLRPSRITQRGHFSVCMCDGKDSSFKIKSLHKKCLSGQQLERDFRVYTIYRDKCIDLDLKYSNSGYNLIDKNLPDLTLCGSPIIDGDNSEKYFVGVLRINTEGKAIPCFLSKGVLEQPAFTTHPNNPLTLQLREGVSTTFSSDANGIPEPTFSWTKDGSAITANDRISLSADNKKLSLTNVNRADSGEYRCVATNSVGTVNSNAATLTVHYQPEFTEHPQSHTKGQGSSVTLSSNANGVPIPTFSWTKDGSAVTANNRISLSADDKQLSLTNVNRTDSGEYRCVAANSVGTVNSNAATLTVTYQPEFIEHPQSHTKVQGSSVTFSSNANGVPIPTFSWTKDGSVVTANDRICLSADNKHLTITNVNGRDRGEYRCEAHNIVNTINSNAATLTIQPFLGLNIDVQEMTSGTESCPPPNVILNAYAHRFVARLNDLEDFGLFVDYLERMRGLLVADAHLGCLIVTVRCSSLQILDELWEDYRTGHLNEMAQKYLVTKEILKKFGLIELKLTTTIVEEEYRACRQYFLQWPDSKEQDVASSTIAQEGEDTQTMDVAVEGEIPADDPGIQDVASLTPSSEGEDTQDKDVKGELPASKAAPGIGPSSLESTQCKTMASTSLPIQEHHQPDIPGKVKVTILASEWGSSKEAFSTLNRELAIQLAKFPEVEITFFLPRCTEGEKNHALGHNVKVVEAIRSGCDELQWLCFPPDDLQIDIVVGHGIKHGYQAQVIRRSKNCKWVQMVHTDQEELGMFKTYHKPVAEGEEKRKIEVKLCEMADLVIGVGPKLSEAFRAYLRGSQKVKCIHDFTPGVLDEFVSVKQSHEEQKHCSVLVYGRSDDEDFELTGFDIAGKAISKVPDTRLVFAGVPEEKRGGIAKRLRESGVCKQYLRVRGFVQSREELKRLFQEMDLVLMPARTEGFGLTGLGALSAGLPVLVSKNSGFGEALSKVQFGSTFVIDSEDPEVWADAIKDVLKKDRKTRLKEAETLRTSYGTKFSWDKQSRDLLHKMISIVQENEPVLRPPLIPVEMENPDPEVKEEGPRNVSDQTEEASCVSYAGEPIMQESNQAGNGQKNLPRAESLTGACRGLSNLPRPSRTFVNRNQEIEDIKKHLLPHPENDCSCVLVHGAVGMGKTATAIKAANEIRDNDDNTAVVYINCNVVNSCDDLAVKISQQIYHFPLNESTAEIKRRLVSEKDLLVILLLDNFQSLDPLHRNEEANMNPEITRIDQTEELKVKKLITEIITASTNVKLLVTSSVCGDVPEKCQHIVRLGPLERSASFELLKNTFCPDRHLDEEIAYKIAGFCDGIPLALISLASWQDHPPDLVEMMTNANPEEKYKKFITIPRTDTSKKIDVCLDACFYRLDQDLRNTVICLSLFKGHFTMSTAQGVFRSEGLKRRILELANRSFLERNILRPTAPCWYRLLGVQKLYCQNKAQEEGAKQVYENGRKSFIDYFLSLLEEVFKKFLSKDAFEACATFRQEVESIMQLLDWFKSGVMDEERTLKCIDVFNEAAELLAKMMGEKRFNAVFNLLKDRCQQLQDKERLSDCFTSLGIKEAFSCFFSPHLSVEAGKRAKNYFMEADRIQTDLSIVTGNSRAQCLAKYGRCVSIIDGNFAEGRKMIKKAIAIRKTHGEEDRVMLGATYNDLAGEPKAAFIWRKLVPVGRAILPAESTLADIYMGKRMTALPSQLVHVLSYLDRVDPDGRAKVRVRKKSWPGQEGDLARWHGSPF